MRSIAGVTLNQPSGAGAQDGDIERFALLYESEAGKAAKAPFQDVALPAVRQTPEVLPRLDITAQVEGEGTRLKAELTKPVTDASGTTRLVTKETSLLLSDIDAMTATQGLAQVLESSSVKNTAPISEDALATRLYEDLLRLLEDLGDLFGDLVLFNPLPDDATLPDLDGYTFSYPYFERFWQLTWASWSGEREFDTEMMFALGLRSSSVTEFGVDFTRRIVEGVKAQATDIMPDAG